MRDVGRCHVTNLRQCVKDRFSSWGLAQRDLSLEIHRYRRIDTDRKRF